MAPQRLSPLLLPHQVHWAPVGPGAVPGPAAPAAALGLAAGPAPGPYLAPPPALLPPAPTSVRRSCAQCLVQTPPRLSTVALLVIAVSWAHPRASTGESMSLNTFYMMSPESLLLVTPFFAGSGSRQGLAVYLRLARNL
jgi:hypothetical protein